MNTPSESSSANVPPPGPKGRRFQHALARLRDTPRFMERLYEQYGPIVSYEIPGRKYCVVFDPELIREVLNTRHTSFRRPSFLGQSPPYETATILTSEGDDHKRHRRLHQPSFGKKGMAAYAEIIVEEAARMRDAWRDGQTIAASREVNNLAVAVAVGAFFGRDMRVDPEVVYDVLQGMVWNLRVGLLPFAALMRALPLPINQRARRAWKIVDEVVYEVIRRARDGQDRTDLISLMACAQDEEGVYASFSDKEIKSEAYAMLIVGHETSSTAMAWSLEYIMRNPAVCDRIEQEVDEVVGGRGITLADYDKLVYTRAVFQETLRHAPPVYFVGREALDDCVIGDYLISKGSIMQPYFPLPQKNKAYFEHGDEFRPEPWLDDSTAARMRLAWFPFGYGPRICIAWQFAMMEGVFMMASIAQRWRLEAVSDKPAKVKATVVYTPKNGVPAIVRERPKR